MITLQEFKQLINNSNKEYITKKWVIDGLTGGSCWGTSHYSREVEITYYPLMN
jgi:hypothetical protein